MRYIVALFALVVGGSLLSSTLEAQKDTGPTGQFALPHPEKAHPEQDCARSIRKGDLRFIGVRGFTINMPGVADDHYWSKYGYKVIQGTSDAGDREFNDAATKYAARYNTVLLKHLQEKRAVHP